MSGRLEDMRTRSWLYTLLAGGAVVAYFAAPAAVQSDVYAAIALSAAVATFVDVNLRRSTASTAWLLFGFAILASAAGDLLFGDGQSTPSIADMLYISAYPLFALSFIALAPSRRQRPCECAALAVAFTAAVTVVCYVFVVLPSEASELSRQIIAFGYPIMDVGLCALLLRARRCGAADGAFALLAIGLVLMFVADVSYAMSDLGGSYQVGDVIDIAWLASYVSLGAGALNARTRSSDVVWETAWADDWHTPPSGGAGVATLTRTRPRPKVTIKTGMTTPLGAQAADIHFRLVVVWSGRMLCGFGAVAASLGAAWMAPDIALLGGGCFFVGLVSWTVSGTRCRA